MRRIGVAALTTESATPRASRSAANSTSPEMASSSTFQSGNSQSTPEGWLRYAGSVTRTRPQLTHDQATRNRSSSRISNLSASPQVGQARGSGACAFIPSAYGGTAQYRADFTSTAAASLLQ